jgi:hypothetical protein
VPTQVHYQGLLLDDLGGPLQGSVTWVFTLYDDITAGNVLWTEARTLISVLHGVYVALGSTTPLTAGVSAVGNVFQAVSVDGETLSPRQQFSSVPYALRAGTATTSLDVDGIEAEFIFEFIETFDFDGGPPSNTDPSEGFGDADLDSTDNFLDDDNDNDGLSDGAELLLGSAIHVITPGCCNFAPPLQSSPPPPP